MYLRKLVLILTVIHYLTFTIFVSKHSDWEIKPHNGHQNNKTKTNNTVICSDTNMKSIPTGWLVCVILITCTHSRQEPLTLSAERLIFHVRRCFAGRHSSSSYIAFTLSTHHPNNKYTQL